MAKIMPLIERKKKKTSKLKKKSYQGTNKKYERLIEKLKIKFL